MRIAFLISTFPSISQAFITNQIIGLIEKGYAVEIFAYRKEIGACDNMLVKKYDLVRKTKYIPHISKNKIKRVYKSLFLLAAHLKKKPLSLIGTLNFFKYGKEALNLNLLYKAIPFLESEPFDLIHCQFGTQGIDVVKLRELGVFKAKIVISFRGYDLSRHLKQRGENVYAELFKKGDLFLPVSSYFRKRLLKLGCEESKIIIHRSGIDLKKFKYLSRNITDTNSIQLLSVGRLVEKKGFEYGIKAVAMLIKNVEYNIKYIIIGDGPLFNNLNLLITELGVEKYVDILGAKDHDQVARYIQESHLLLAPSVTSADGDQEGIPNILKEAMATGMPVISTYHSGIPELVKNGISGYLAPEKDANNLAKMIEHTIIYSEEWDKIGRAGKKTVENFYDINKLNNELLDIYKYLLSL